MFSVMLVAQVQSFTRSPYVQVAFVLAAIFLAFEFLHPSCDESLCANQHLSSDSTLTLRDGTGPCSQVPQDHIRKLQDHGRLRVHSFANGAAVLPSLQLDHATKVCILISVPQHQPLEPSKDVPIPGKGPDNLHIHLNSSKLEISFPPPRPLPGQKGLDQLVAPSASIVYFVETSLYHGGQYEIHVDHEWANWRWANQWWNDFEHNMIRYPTGLRIPFYNKTSREADMHTTTFYNWASIEVAEKYPDILTVKADDEKWERHRLQTPCKANALTSNGRWYSKSAFPALTQDFDEWDYAWDGNECHFDWFDEREMMDCMANTKSHFYGDSQLRRNAKALVSGGHFCRDTSHRCQHDDGALPYHSLISGENGDLVDHLEDEGPLKFGRFQPFPFGYQNDSTIYFNFIRDLAGNWRDWSACLYDEEDHGSRPGNLTDDTLGHLRSFQPYFDLRLGSKARMPPDVPKPDFVVLGFGSWDTAFDPTFEEYETALRSLRDAVLEAYPPEVLIVLRLSNGYCCRHGFEDYRRYTGVRIQHMNDIVKKTFRVEGAYGMDQRVFVYDPEALTGRPNVVSDYEEVQTNHPRFSHVRIEAQMMLNKICERDPTTKKARLRKARNI